MNMNCSCRETLIHQRVVWIVVRFLVLVTATGVSLPGTAEPISRLSDVETALRDKDKLPVIVELNVPAARQPAGVEDEGWLNFNDHLDAIQNRAIEEFGWQNFNDIVKFKTQASLARAVDDKELEQLLKSSSVNQVFVDETRRPFLTKSSELVGLTRLESPERLGGEMAVAVLDTGVDRRHPFLQDKVVAEACFSRNGSCPDGRRRAEGPGSGIPCRADCSHGTHVAGIAAGANGSMTGTAPAANVVAVQVFSVEDDEVTASDSDILQALEWVYLNHERHGIAAVNLSLGGRAYRQECDQLTPYKQVFDLLTDAGIAVIVASGNASFTDRISAPACISSGISVGSLDKSGTVSEFSNSYPRLRIMAPGGKIISSVPGGEFARKSGTSMAAPHVAGAWVSLAAAFPQADYDDIYSAMFAQAPVVSDSRNGHEFPTLRLDLAYDSLAGRFDRPAPDQPGKKPDRPAPPKQPVPEDPERIDGILIEDRDDESDKPSRRW